MWWLPFVLLAIWWALTRQPAQTLPVAPSSPAEVWIDEADDAEEFADDDTYGWDDFDHFEHDSFDSEPSWNPATGLPMCGSTDVAGNPYGFDLRSRDD